MASYYYDAEFIEGHHKPFWGKRRHFIDLISIDIVREDGVTYSAISSEYDYKDASEWVRKNVIIPLYTSTVHGDQRNLHDANNFHKAYGKPNAQIAKEIIQFICYGEACDYHIDIFGERKLNKILSRVQLIGYYSAYDHVLLCSLFGTMMNLPSGMPMFTYDLQQLLEDKIDLIFSRMTSGDPDMSKLPHKTKVDFVKNSKYFPVNRGEHTSKGDALWTKELHKFIQKYAR